MNDNTMTPPFLTPLSDNELRACGIPDDWHFGIANRVRFSELDALGHVNNAAYLSWFENTRLPYLRAMEVTDYGPGAPRLVLAELGVRYLSEMLLDQDYVITARTREIRTSSFIMDYAVWRLEQVGATEAARSHAAIVLRTRDGTGKYPIPAAARRNLIADGATGTS